VTALEINGDFTGTYVSGICKGWSASGGATYAQNTDKSFIKHGTASQKITATMFPPALGGIVSTDSFPLRKRSIYYAEISVYIDVHQCRILLQNQTSGANDIDFTTTGKGWTSILITGLVPSGDDSYKWTIWGVANSGSAPVVYVDSIMITIGLDQRPFTRKSIADDLRIKALDAMGLNEFPAKTFSLDMADLGELEPNIESANRFQPGDYIPIDDKTLNVVATLRVQSKTTDLINPEKSQISVELLPTRPGDVIFRALGRPELALQRSG